MFTINVFLISNSILFLLMSLIHVYWAFGGKWGTEGVLPSRDGQKVLNPRPIGTLAVAAVLGGFALGSLNAMEWSPYISLTIGVLFSLRVIGDFNYVGLFKRVRNTVFARSDNRYFIPLCLYIGTTNLFVFWYMSNLL